MKFWLQLHGAFWINLDHQLRGEIFSNIVYSSPATYFILVIVMWHKEGSYWETEDFFRIWDCTPTPPPFIMRRSPLLAVFCFRSISVPFHAQIAVIAVQSNAKLVRRTTPTIFLGHCPLPGQANTRVSMIQTTQYYSFVKLCIITLFTCVTYVLIKYIYILAVVYLSLYFTLSDFSKSYFTFSVLWKIIFWSHVLTPPPPLTPPPLPPPPIYAPI